MNTSEHFRAGTIEFFSVRVTADVELHLQSISISIDEGATWEPATWVGVPGKERVARTNRPIEIAGPHRVTEVLVKIQDEKEAPLLEAGAFVVDA